MPFLLEALLRQQQSALSGIQDRASLYLRVQAELLMSDNYQFAAGL